MSVPDSLLADVIAEIVSRVPATQAIYQFGSTVRGDDRPGSDLDLALLASAPLTALGSMTLAADLGASVGRDVDLIDLRRASTVLRAQIVSTGHRVFTADSAAAELFEMLAYSQYATLNEERAGILADIARRGSVHG